MPGRNFSSADQYRYGYQGSEKDDEVNPGNISTYYRELDTRLGRWWAVDPKFELSPFESPYVSMTNNPLWVNDVRGDHIDVQTNEDHKGDKPNEKAKSNIESFKKNITDVFKGKVSLKTSEGSVNNVTRISGIEIKEGQTLSNEEQIAYEYLNGLAMQPGAFSIMLEDGPGAIPPELKPGQLFSFTNDPMTAGRSDMTNNAFDLKLNYGLLKTSPAVDNLFSTSGLIHFAIAAKSGNIEKFAKATGKEVTNYSFNKFVIKPFNNYAVTAIEVNGYTMNIMVGLTKRVNKYGNNGSSYVRKEKKLKLGLSLNSKMVDRDPGEYQIDAIKK